MNGSDDLQSSGNCCGSEEDANGNPVANTFTVTVAADVTPGLYDVRVKGLFWSQQPTHVPSRQCSEIAEVEPNNLVAQATPVVFRIRRECSSKWWHDVDFYKVPVAAGQTLVIRSEAARLDSPMQPMMQLFNTAGRRVAESRRNFSAGSQHRLHRHAG